MASKTMELKFNENHSAQIVTIAKYYEIAKELIILGEQIDPENRTLPQPINELRNCLDHLTRVFLYRAGLRHIAEGEKYVDTNLDKAYGHVYRAAYDALDWVSLTLKERVVEELKPYSNSTISSVVPEYYRDIRPRIEEILSVDISKLKMEKDVAISNEDNLILYGKLTLEMRELFNRIIKCKSSLVECRAKEKNTVWVTRGWQIIAALLGGGIIWWAIDRFLLHASAIFKQ